MKSASEEKTEVFESSFKAFLYTDNKNTSSSSGEMRLKIKRQDLFQNAHYETKTIPFSLQAKFSYYDLFENFGIDTSSKETIICEISPKDKLILLGETYNGPYGFDEMILKIKEKCNVPCEIISNDNKASVTSIKDNLLSLKYDSTVLNSLPSVFVKDYGFVYDLKNTFLKVKTHRGDVKEISIVEEAERKQVGNNLMGNVMNLENRNSLLNVDNDDEMDVVCKDKNTVDNVEYMNKEVNENLDCFYMKKDIKLINLKREISKILNEEFFVYKNYITNANHDFKLYLKKDELTLEGSLNPTYLRIRNCVYSNYLNLYEL